MANFGDALGLLETGDLVLRDPPSLLQKCISQQTWADAYLGRRLGGKPVGTGDLPAWLENSPATFLSLNFEVDACLARNAVLSRMPLPSLDLAHPVPSKDPTLEAYTCVSSESLLAPSGSSRPFLPLALQWGRPCFLECDCPSPPEKLTHCE